MRAEDDQEIVRRVLHYDPEQPGQRGPAYVRSHREKYDDREGQEVCGKIRWNGSFSTNGFGTVYER